MFLCVFVLAIAMFFIILPLIGAFIFCENGRIPHITLHAWAWAATTIVCRFLLQPKQWEWVALVFVLFWGIYFVKAVDTFSNKRK